MKYLTQRHKDAKRREGEFVGTGATYSRTFQAIPSHFSVLIFAPLRLGVSIPSLSTGSGGSTSSQAFPLRKTTSGSCRATCGTSNASRPHDCRGTLQETRVTGVDQGTSYVTQRFRMRLPEFPGLAPTITAKRKRDRPLSGRNCRAAPESSCLHLRFVKQACQSHCG